MATAAVEQPQSAAESATMPTEASQSKRFSARSLRWSRKLFGSDKPGKKAEEAAHDVKAAAVLRPPTSNAPNTAVEETDTIQRVPGTDFFVNDPGQAINPAAPAEAEPGRSHDTARNETQGVVASSSRQRLDGTDPDPTEGAGAVSAVSGRSGSALPTDDEGESRAPSLSGHRPNGKGVADDEVDRIEFYRKDQPYFWLSNSSEHVVYLDGEKYPTAEHLFQALKFIPAHRDIARRVRKASTPDEAIREARKNMTSVKRGWISQGQNIETMRLVLLLKFSQHSKLSRQLLSTGDAELVEASPTDAFWGAAMGGKTGGISGLGRNELGRALQRTRESIRNQAGLGWGSAAQTV